MRVLSTLAALAVLVALAAAPEARAEPLFTLAEDGRTFLYRARPGDHPGVVAEMFGISPHDLPAFLAANGITDPTRVGAGFTYRIPNAAAQALAERMAALERDNAQLRRTLDAENETTTGLRRATDEARSAAAEAASRLTHLESLWPWVRPVIGLLLLACGGAVYIAVAALRRHAQMERYARTLARELEQKRKAGLVERQESARHILDLETRIRTLEAQAGPRVVISGRGGS
jgi:hypothetical protein